MNRLPSPEVALSEEALARLINILHETVDQIEHLTAGEVDSVTDRQGRTLLLGRAQAQLRHSEEVKEAAVLDALSAQIALIDVSGKLISVNKLWKQSEDVNGLVRGGHGIGTNYLQICDDADVVKFKGAPIAATGIRSVLRGDVKDFTFEYECGFSQVNSVFVLTVTPLGGNPPRGAVLMHTDISAPKLAQQYLDEFTRKTAQRERLLSTTLSSLVDCAFVFDRSARFLYANQSLLSLWGLALDQVVGKSFTELGYPDDLTRIMETQIQNVFENRESIKAETPYVSPTGESGVFEYIFSPGPIVDGEVEFVAGSTRNVTERIRSNEILRASELSVRRLNRVHSVLSEINALIVRVQNRNILFEEACRIAVEQGGFSLAVVSTFDHLTAEPTSAASSSNDEKFAVVIQALLGAEKALQSMVETAIEQKGTLVCNNTQLDHNWFVNQTLAAADILSIAVFPLIVSSTMVGAFALCSNEIDFFHADEVKLLTELTADISFATDYLVKQDRLHHLAYFDSLTGLANRSLFLERLDRHLQNASLSRKRVAVAIIDLERFKNLNDNLGQQFGNLLLQKVADWLTKNLGGAEFLA